VVGNILYAGQEILFDSTYRLRKTSSYTERFVKTAAGIFLNPNNFDSNEFFTLSPAW